jgi:hypothetical protein
MVTSGSSAAPTRHISYVLLFTHVVVAGMLSFLGMEVLPPAEPMVQASQVAPVAYALALLGIAATLFVAFVKMTPRAQPGEPVSLPPSRFIIQLIIALSCAESIVLVGAFIGVAAGLPMLPFGVAGGLLMLGVILPQINAYWGAYEAEGA